MINRIQQSNAYNPNFNGGHLHVDKAVGWNFADFVRFNQKSDFGVVPAHLNKEKKLGFSQIGKQLRAAVKDSDEFRGEYVMTDFREKNGVASAILRHFIKKDSYIIEDPATRFVFNPTHLLNPKKGGAAGEIDVDAFVKDYADYVEGGEARAAVVQKHSKNAWNA